MRKLTIHSYGEHGPEGKVKSAIVTMLRNKGWYVMMTHGNMFQSGFPDLFATHSKYGIRWIEVKLPNMKGSHFTPAQLDCFPKMCANGAGVWILTSDGEEEYAKLFISPNWWVYLDLMKPRHRG